MSELYTRDFRERLAGVRNEHAALLVNQAKAAATNSSFLSKYLNKFEQKPSPATVQTQRFYSDIFNSELGIDPKLRTFMLNEIERNARSTAAVLSNRVGSTNFDQLALPQVLSPQKGKHVHLSKGFMIWNERLEDQNHELGVFMGTVLLSNNKINELGEDKRGKLFNTDIIPVNNNDLEQAVGPNGEIPQSYINFRIAAANKGLHPITLENNDMSYESHIDHLARFVVKHSLDIFQVRPLRAED